jgi:hypothetical protein
MICSHDPLAAEWIADFIQAWRLDFDAPDGFWLLMSRLSVSEILLVREAMALTAKRAFESGSGVPVGR